MANTYTTKLGLAKPANGDVDWHIPINDNWDKIDTELDKALKISGTTIDADKNWNGKSITNVETLSTNLLILPESPFTIVPVTTKNAKYLMKSDDIETPGTTTKSWTLTKSLLPLPASVIGTENSVYVSYQHKSSHQSFITQTQIHVNGVAIGTSRAHSSTLYITWDEVITGLKAGDIIQIYTLSSGEGDCAYVRNLRVYGGTSPLIPMIPGIW